MTRYAANITDHSYFYLSQSTTSILLYVLVMDNIQRYSRIIDVKWVANHVSCCLLKAASCFAVLFEERHFKPNLLEKSVLPADAIRL